MADIDTIEIIDAQIHEPYPSQRLSDEHMPLLHTVQVELAREAMDAIGVDQALSVTSDAFIEKAAELHPGRFPGVHTFMHTVPDMEAEVRRIAAHPAMVAGRALVGNFIDAVMRPEFDQGVYDPIYATAAEVGLPIFNSTHGGCAKMAKYAERHPELTLIIDHIGVAQHPVSPPETMSWKNFPDLLELARYPNVAVKLCGAPLLSDENYPFDDIWPKLDQLFEAFGFDRVMWGSDYTRMRISNRPLGDRPRKRGMTYAESLDYLRRTDRLSLEEKRMVLGGTARKLFKLPPVADIGVPGMNWPAK